MSFVNPHYLIYITVGFGILFFSNVIFNFRYFKWIKTYWFFERSFASKISTFLYYISIFLIFLSLLDLRGPEQKIKGALPDQKTVIMLDSSLSMLSEDVRPNRYVKAIQLARHFVKNSAGHQISIVLFSDTQKRLIPFTDDVDLIDSRLAALENTNSVGGGSSISQAVTEVVGYFQSSEDDDRDVSGNIILFTDAEEGEGGLDVNLPSTINLAVVGVGTTKGGFIPLRYEDGAFRGYKTKNGENVTTKLDEKFISDLGKKVKNYNYWIVNSYSLPTDEILNFFRSTYKKLHNNGDLRVRPVYSHFILIPAIIFYCLAVMLGRLNTFKIVSILFIFLTLSSGQLQAEVKQAKISKSLEQDLKKLKEGKSNHREVLKTAEKLLKENQDSKASDLYSEYIRKQDDEEVKFNYATSLLKQGKLKEGIPIASELLAESKNVDLKEKLRKNILKSISDSNQNNKNENKDNKENKEEKENKDNKESNDKKDGKKSENKEDKEKKEGTGKNNNDKQKGSDQKAENSKNQSSKSGEEKEDKKENGNKDKEDKKDKGKSEENKPEQKEGPKNLEEKEREIEQKRRMTKMPGMIKQILNDDRELQKKMMDTKTREKGDLKPAQDW